MATVGTPESIAQLKNEIENVEEQIAQLIQGVGDNEPLKVVVLDGLTVSKIVKHCKESLPVLVTGQLLGLDVGSTLEVTNCFPFPSAGTEEEADNDYAVEYQIEMMKCLRKAKMDNNTVGWYHSTYLGSFLSESIIETQFNYQDAIPKSVVVVYDPLKSSQGALSLQAYRLTDAFMELYRVQDFTQESLERAKLSFNDVFEEIPIQIKNAHLNSAFLWEVEDSASWGARGLDFDRLDLSTNPFLEKNLEFLVEYIDELVGEQNKLQNHYRAVQRQQQQQTAWYAKRKSENEARRRSGQTELPEEDPDNPIFKNIQPPSRLEGLLITNQINSYCQQINQFAGQSFAKLFLYNGLRKDASGNSI